MTNRWTIGTSALALMALSTTALASSATPAGEAIPTGSALGGAAVPVPPPAVADPCATPRGVVSSWFDNLRADQYLPEDAVRCFNAGALGLEPAELVDRAIKLKRILDARGLELDLDAIPDDAAYPGAPAGKYILSDELEEIYLERVEGRWLVAERTVRAADRLFNETVSPLVRGVVQLLPDFAFAELLGVALWKWLGLFILLLLAYAIQKVTLFLITRQVRRLTSLLKHKWPQKVVSHVAGPVAGFATAGVLAVGLPQLELPVGAARIGAFGTRLIALVSLIWLGFRAIEVISDFLAEKAELTESKLDDQLVPLVRRVAQVFVAGVGVLFVLQNLKVDVSSLLAGLGIGGLAFALAAKDTVGNLFGSVTIFLDKPFQLGDWIKVGDVEGTVEEVGMRSTRVRTFYNSLVSVPNATFSDAVVDNIGLREWRRCVTTIGLTYDTPPAKLEAMVQGLRAIIDGHPATRKDYYQIHFKEFGPSSLDIMLYFFLATADWTGELAAKHQIFMEILRLAESLGVSFAFPSQSVYVETMAQPTPAKPAAKPDLAALGKIVEGYGPGGALARPGGEPITDRFPPDPAAKPS